MPVITLPTDQSDSGIWGPILNTAVTTVNTQVDTNTTDLTGRLKYRGVWAGSTAYAVNDLVTRGEGIYVVTAAHTSGSTFGLTNLTRLNKRVGVYDVTDYGAVGDGSTDDTAAINAAVRAAVAGGIADGTYYAEVRFPPKQYVVSGATITGATDLGSGLGVAKGNAQIPLPIIASTGKKFVLTLSGGATAAGLAHWEQTTGQRAGAVIRTTLTGLSSDGTWGAPSIIGGPTVYDDGAGFPFSNMLLRVDGLTLMAPSNPGIIALDARDIAQLEIGSVSILADAGPAGSPALTTIPSNGLGIGVRVPQNGNNDAVIINSLGVEGFQTGATMGEHMTVLRAAFIYCDTALFVTGIGGASYHGVTFVNLSVEACNTIFQCVDNSGGAFPVEVLTLSVESINTWELDDIHGNLVGTVRWNDAATAHTPKVRAGGLLKFISNQLAALPGAKTAPGIPSSTVALANPFWRDCAVNITGGTVTVIAVDGQTTGLTAGTVVVPSGKTVTLTYSVAPTWKWTAL